MSKEFIESKQNSHYISKASNQQKRLLYFTESEIQEDITIEYLEQWANRKYKSSDDFLNFLKSVFKIGNFLLMYKYMRKPLPSASLISDKVKTPLKRVFWSEDPYFNYEINGESYKNPKFLDIEQFNDVMFNALLYRHNDIVIVDLDGINNPFRTIVSIDNVISIDSKHSVINKIAYSAKVNGDIGILYIDDKSYKFYSKDLDLIIEEPHDLGRCPADYISSDYFTESDVLRKSIFTNSREKLEEFVFLKTLQRMVEASSVIPTVTMLDAGIKENGNDSDVVEGEPMSLKQISGQKATKTASISGGNQIMESGNLIRVPLQRDDSGKVDMDIVKNYLNFFYVPIESLEYLNKRVRELRVNIISDLLGDYTENSTPQGSKSNLEAGINIVSRQDKIRDFSKQLSRLRERTDYNMLALKFGKENIFNEAFYGSDFFLETQEDIYNLIKKAPNPIEQKSLLIKSARNRNRFNKDGFTRDFILYHLIPYGNIDDFDKAVSESRIGDITFQYQTRFNYWIGLFEAEFGDISTFWNSSKSPEYEKTQEINQLILNIIKDNYEKSSVFANL